MHLHNFLLHNTLRSLTKFLPEQLNLEGQWEVAISESFYPSMYQIVTQENVAFFDKKLSISPVFNYLEPGLYSSLTVFIEAMNTLIQERQNHSESCITTKVSRRVQKIEIYLANDGSGLAFFSTELWHFFGSNVGNESGLMLRGKESHFPENAYDIVCILSLLIYTDLIEHVIVGVTKAPFVRCFPFISKLQNSRLETLELLDSTWITRPLVIYRSSRSSKFFFEAFTLTWETREVKKIPFVSKVVTRLVLRFRKAKNSHF